MARRTSSAASPHRSLIDAVLDEQFMPEAGQPQQQQAVATDTRIAAAVDLHDSPGVASKGDNAAVVTVAPSARHRRRGGGAAVRQQQRPAQHRAERFADATRTGGDRDDSSDVENSDTFEDSEWQPLHQKALRLQPLPPAAPASALMEEVEALVGNENGDVVETFADVFAAPTTPARRTTHSAAQSMLAAERARLLRDSPGTVAEGDAVGAVTNWYDADTRERLWRPTTEPRVVTRAFRPGSAPCQTRGRGAASTKSPQRRKAAASPAALPAVVVEFLQAEADAEMAVKAAPATITDSSENKSRVSLPRHAPNAVGSRASPSRATTAPATAPRTPPPHPPSPPVPSPAAESAAVLRELKDLQRRLRGHGHCSEKAATLTETKPKTGNPVAATLRSSEGLESFSPCDISTTLSSASSTATTSSTTTAGRRRRQGSARKSRMGDLSCTSPEYWATASITEIVDVIDGRCTMAPGRKRQMHRKQRGQPDFDPTRYARRLLDRTARSCTTSAASDDTDHAYFDDSDGDAKYDPAGHRSQSVQEGLGGDERDEHASGSRHRRPRSAPGVACDPSLAARKREALLRSGPTWATAATEIGLTPAELQDLLRYSLSSPDAATTWLAVGSHRAQDGTGTVEAVIGAQDNNDVDRRRTERVERHGHGEAGGPRPYAQPPPLLRSDPVSLDVAAQTALVQRIVAALPAVPVELQEELSRQRRLLERVCRDVRLMSAPAHAAVQARLTSPTVSFMAARQPSPVEFSTGASGGGGGGAETSPPTAAEAHKERQHLLFTSLPRPAAFVPMAARGLCGAAADPSRPLPPVHSDAMAPREPYEMALRELAERETHHYVSELDRQRTMYDRQLQEERRQRTQERRHYAELLQSQQHKLLRHHRETVHLLQRECRLQQQQQESLVQQLAASQEAAAQRQRAQHEHTTKKMLEGATDVMKSYVMAEGPGRGGHVTLNTPTRVAATPGGAAHRRRQRPCKRKQTAGSPDPSQVAAAAAGTPPHTPTSPPCADVASKRDPSDAGMPTAQLLSPRRRSTSPTHTAPPLSAPSSSVLSPRSNNSNDGAREPHAGRRMPPLPPAAAADAAPIEPNFSDGAVTPTAEDDKGMRHHTSGITTPVIPSRAAGPKPSTNRIEMLRAVYVGDAARSQPPRPRTQGRMTLPLHVCLPPEEDTHPRQALGAATLAAELADLRATAAARDAGLVEGTRLYGAQPRRHGPPDAPQSASTGEAAVQRLHPAVPHRALSVSPSSTGVERHARTPNGKKMVKREAAKSRRGSSTRRAQRSKSGDVKWPGRSLGRRPGCAAPHATLGCGGVANRASGRLPRRFDMEAVSLLSSETGTTPLHVCALQSEWAAHTPQCGVDVRGGVPPGGVHYGGTWSEVIHEGVQDAHSGTARGQETADAVIATAGVTASKPAVGRPLLVLSPPRIAVGGLEEVTHAMSGAATATTPALCMPQATDAQLRLALHHRAGVVSALRHEAPSSPSPPQAAAAAAASGGDGHTMLNAVGSLPPCDSVFFGAPAEILINAADGPIIGDDANNATQNAPSAASAPLGMLTDYARAWARYVAAEREVESRALALATEDAGVLSAVASAPEHRRHRQGGGEDDAAPAAVTIPRPSSVTAAVHYRESELGCDNPALQRGSVHVSSHMAAEARALTEARRRLSAIRACFITPPSLGAASRGRATGMDAALRDNALVRQLVDATVLSVLEVQNHQSHADPVRQVMVAMEHELLRLMLAGCLEAGAGTTSGVAEEAKTRRQRAQSPRGRRLDPELACAFAEAALQEAVDAALENCRSGRKTSRAAASASTPNATGAAMSTATTAFAQTAQAAPMNASLAAEVDLRERVPIPLTASTAWLRDESPMPETTPLEQEGPKTSDAQDGQGAADAITATATVVLPPPRGGSRDATNSAALGSAEPTLQEVRVVVDLSPVVRNIMMSHNSVFVTPTQSSQQQQQVEEGAPHRPRPHPPIQQEQLPSRWMALEDRRDVIVETECRVVAAAKRTEMSPPTVADAAMQSKHTPALSPAAAPLPPPPPPVPSDVNFASAHRQDAAPPADRPTSHDALHLTMLHLLQSALLDQERLQRASLSDREEEQRRAHELLREASKVAVHQRTLAGPLDASAEPPPSGAAIPTTQPHLALPQQPVATTVVDAPRHEDGETTEATASRVGAPPSPQLPPVAAPSTSATRGASMPPVRDPVMGYVLEWIRQFGASQQLRSSMRSAERAAASPSLVEGLTAAAQTAAKHVITPRAQGTAQTPLANTITRHAVSRPSTRNLGSSTSMESTSSSSPSMTPSSYTSSSSMPTDQAWGRLRIHSNEHSGEPHAQMPHHVSSRAPLERPPMYLHAPIRKARPMLDRQRDDASSSTATTHYTTGRNSLTSGIADESRVNRAASSGSSRLLPPRASAEVQAALAAALRAHQQANRPEVSTMARAEESSSGMDHIPLGSGVGNTSHAVSPPARSAGTTAVMRTPPPAFTASAVPRTSLAELHTPPPTWSSTTRSRVDVRVDDNGEARHVGDDAYKRPPSVGARDKVAGTTVAVEVLGAPQQRAIQPKPTASNSAAAWGNISLTSTSTSSHSRNGGARGNTREVAHAYPAGNRTLASSAIGKAAPASSALPFMLS
ncbi:hypothetical protein JKF63_07768 [Porcisia hertigi]|uniref:Uncharacterized protein n=1 Tax=Porcisia hertigi TaxID=2761500 RepID=A0A836LM41_9TRYP|nr:hypothetical protein JKF63_07768 [Porcisia hertigi]